MSRIGSVFLLAALLLAAISPVLGETIETPKGVYSLKEVGKLNGPFEVTQDLKFLVVMKDKRFECASLSDSSNVLGSIDVAAIRYWRLHGQELMIVDGAGWKVYSLPDLKLAREIEKRILTSDTQRKGDITRYPTLEPSKDIVPISNGWTDGVYAWDGGATKITAIVAEPVLTGDTRGKPCEWRSLASGTMGLAESIPFRLRESNSRLDELHEYWPFAMESDGMQGIRLRFFDLLRFQKTLSAAIFFRSSGTGFTFINNGVGFLVTLDQIKQPEVVEPVGFVQVQPDFTLPSKSPWIYHLIHSDKECAEFRTAPSLTSSGGINFTTLDGTPIQELANIFHSPDWQSLQKQTIEEYVEAVGPEFERIVGTKPTGFPFPFVVTAEYGRQRFKHLVWSDIPLESLASEIIRQRRPEIVSGWKKVQSDKRKAQAEREQLEQNKVVEAELAEARKQAEASDLKIASQYEQRSDFIYHCILFGLAGLGMALLLLAAFVPKLQLSILFIPCLAFSSSNLNAQNVRVSEGSEFCEMRFLPVPGVRDFRSDPNSNIACVLLEKKTGAQEIGIINLDTGKPVKKFSKPENWDWKSTILSASYAVSFDGKEAHVFQLADGKPIQSFPSPGGMSARFIKPDLLVTREGVFHLPKWERIDISPDAFYATSLEKPRGGIPMPECRADGSIHFNGFEVGQADSGQLQWSPKDFSGFVIEPAKVTIRNVSETESNKKKKGTQIDVFAVRGKSQLHIRGSIASELVELNPTTHLFSEGVARAYSAGVLILRWKQAARAQVGAVQVRVDKVPMVSSTDTRVVIEARVDSEQNVIRVGNELQAASSRFRVSFEPPLLRADDLGKMLVRECSWSSQVQLIILSLPIELLTFDGSRWWKGKTRYHRLD